MKKYILATILAAIAFAGCENIDEGDRFIPSDGPKSKKVILLEEFTGVRCPNCPAAARTAHDIMGLYPDNVVTIAMHGSNTGGFGTPINSEQDFRVDGVEELFDKLGGIEQDGFPKGIVNRSVRDGSLFSDYDAWMNYVKQELEKPQLIDLSIKKTADNGSSIDIEIDATTLAEITSGDHSLVVQVIEDGIVGPQYDNGVMNEKYVHNHVLRSFVNGVWGESILLSDVIGQSETKTVTVEFEKEWEKDNCSVVAYVYNTSSKRNILQAAILPMSEGGGDHGGDVTINLSRKELYFAHLDTAAELKASLSGAPDDAVVVWASEDETIASVEKGMVTPIAYGSTYITATYGDVQAKCKVVNMEVEGEFAVYYKKDGELVRINQDTSMTFSNVEYVFPYETGVIFFKGVIFSNLDDYSTLVMRVTRTDHEKLEDEGCIGISCVPNNTLEMQNFSGRVSPYWNAPFDYYFKPKDKTKAETYTIKHEYFIKDVVMDTLVVNATYEWNP